MTTDQNRPFLTGTSVDKLNTIIAADKRIRNFRIQFYTHRVKLLLYGRKMTICITMSTFDEAVTTLKERLQEKQPVRVTPSAIDPRLFDRDPL